MISDKIKAAALREIAKEIRQVSLEFQKIALNLEGLAGSFEYSGDDNDNRT